MRAWPPRRRVIVSLSFERGEDLGETVFRNGFAGGCRRHCEGENEIYSQSIGREIVCCNAIMGARGCFESVELSCEVSS